MKKNLILNCLIIMTFLINLSLPQEIVETVEYEYKDGKLVRADGKEDTNPPPMS